jgi:hypothetical protein
MAAIFQDEVRQPSAIDLTRLRISIGIVGCGTMCSASYENAGTHSGNKTNQTKRAQGVDRVKIHQLQSRCGSGNGCSAMSSMKKKKKAPAQKYEGSKQQLLIKKTVAELAKNSDAIW